MYDLDLKKVNRAMVKAVKLAVAGRRLVGCGGEGYVEVMDVEREFREAAAECQRVLELVEADADRPLIEG